LARRRAPVRPHAIDTLGGPGGSKDRGITVQLMGVRINAQVGSAPVLLAVEWSEVGEDHWQTGTTVFDVGKFPADFYLRNLIAKPLIIDNGGAVDLTWEVGGASSLRLLYDTADINVLGQTTYPVNSVRHTTVFYLRATVQVGTNTAERILSTNVTIRVPDLEVQNLTVRGRIAVLRGTRTASTSLGTTSPYTLDLMLDGDLDTYYLTGRPNTQSDWLTLDLGVEQPISAVRIHSGARTASSGHHTAGCNSPPTTPAGPTLLFSPASPSSSTSLHRQGRHATSGWRSTAPRADTASPSARSRSAHQTKPWCSRAALASSASH
jgi:hypothetical protein